MNKKRIALLGTFAVLVAVWVSSATLPPAPLPAAAPRPAAKAARDATRTDLRKPHDVTSFDLNDAAERLRARLNTHAHSRDLDRNPFEFGQAPAPRAAMPAAAAAAMAAPPAPVDLPPPFALSGVAERKNGDVMERTAILSGNGQIYFAKVGDRVAGRYEVTAIGADAIELREMGAIEGGGRIVRLGLR
jgi:hypothetical protein